MSREILTGAAAIAEGESKAFRRLPRPRNYNENLVEAARILKGVETGSYSALGRLQEAMTTPDFPIYLAAILDRELLPAYQSLTPVWTQYARRTTLRDFRPKKFVDLVGGQGLLGKVEQAAPYPARALDEGEYSIAVGKYGARFPMTFEDFVNDDLGEFRTLPSRLAIAAGDTESYLAASTVATATGPNTALFKNRTKVAGTPNPISNPVDNKPLTIDNLSAALTLIAARRDIDGRPVAFPSLVLLVPPALEVQANIILGATEITITDASGKEAKVTNYLRGKVTLVVDPWLSVIDQSSKSATTWYILPAPAAPRPAIAFGFLRGHETPQLRVKNDQGTLVGGGSIDPTDGSFDDDTIQYRVRHVIGAATLDPIGTYASTGQ